LFAEGCVVAWCMQMARIGVGLCLRNQTSENDDYTGG
jgi:hypothetical protein